MAVKWNCDVCGKETNVNPQTKPVMEDKPIQVPEVDPTTGQPVQDDDGKVKMKTVMQKVQKRTTVKVQDMITGKVTNQEIGLFEDVTPRAYIVRLGVGQEVVQRDVCKTCLDTLMPLIRPMWDKLEKMEGK